GLTREPIVPTQRQWLSIGEIDEKVKLDEYSTSPPFEPMDRCSPADAYWAAKRIAALSSGTIQRALAAAFFTDADARDRLAKILEARRDAIVRQAFAAVTPLEVAHYADDRLELRDEAIARGYADPRTTWYEVTFLDDVGGAVLEPRTVRPDG